MGTEEDLSHAAHLWHANKFADAYAIYDELLRLVPGDARVLRAYGKAKWYEFKGDSEEEATRLLELAVAADPTSVDGLLWLAQMYGNGYGEGYQAAEQLCIQAIELAPDVADGYISLGMLRGRPEVRLTRSEAADCFRTATLLAPDRVDAHANLAMMCIELGDVETATKELRVAIALSEQQGRPERARALQQTLSKLEQNQLITGVAYANESLRFQTDKVS